jgi:hypothetical protein
VFNLNAYQLHSIYRTLHSTFPEVEPDIFIDYQIIDGKPQFAFGYDSNDPVPTPLVAVIYREKILRYLKSLPTIGIYLDGDQEITKCSVIYYAATGKKKIQTRVFANKVMDVAIVDAAWFALNYWKELNAEHDSDNVSNNQSPKK